MSTYFDDLSPGERTRLGIVAFVFGPAILLTAVSLLHAHELAAAHLASDLREGGAQVAETDAGQADPAVEGKLVHLVGDLRVEGTLHDPDFDVTTTGIALLRKVEVYEWQEESVYSKYTSGGYKHTKKWSGYLDKTKYFIEPAGHENPESMAYESARFDASEVRLGTYVLDPKVVAQFTVTENVRMKEGEFYLPRGAKLDYPWRIYLGRDPANPRVGDLRIDMSRVPMGMASVVAAVRSGRLVPYRTRSGEEIALAQNGRVEAAAMFTKNLADGDRFRWLWRVAEALGLYVGLMFFFDLLIVLMPGVRFLARVARRGGIVASLPGSLALGLSVAGAAWLPTHPPVGGALLAAAVLVGWGVLKICPAPPAAGTPVPGAPPGVQVF